ncbi:MULTISPECIES: carbohydrate kinase family protein [unclassified Curtobacterium]|uniref:carbohydrate kinase family protein n=1 Tax=unclassified Curtobacterium TaxID=257496 RepID=UPI00226B3603|nr:MULTISPECIES: carbohydrate kinase [unclassified Curtobacterium]
MTAPAADARSRPALVIGETLVDAVRRADGTTSRHPGGAGANVALGLARLGHPVVLGTHTGRDDDGRTLRAPLEAAGVTIDEVHRSPSRPSHVAHAELDADGAATYAFDVDWDVRPTLDPLRPPVLVHTGCLGTLLLPGAEAVLETVRRARETSFVSYDVNMRPAAVADTPATVARVEAFVAASHLVKASDEDLAWLYPSVEPAEVATAWSRSGPAVVLTRGSEGATLFTDGHTEHAPARRVPVADTIGAGDAFCAAFLSSLWHQDAFERGPRDVPTWRAALHHAVAAAAWTVSRPGADPPTSEDLDRFRRSAPERLRG